jgi:predicted metal-dependent HD superfamily phosphohydrolase
MNHLAIVIPHYSGFGRFYHDFNHITTMLANYGHYRGDFNLHPSEEKALIDAILYHDVVWEPKPGPRSNEVLSAKFYRRTMMSNDMIKSTEDMLHVETVCDMIECTQYHFERRELIMVEGGKFWLAEILMDLDIMAFSLFYEKFCTINRLIANEFQTKFSFDEVQKGRISFLKNIADKKLLKFTQIPDKVKRTEQAYDNINRWLEEQG